MGLSSFYGKWGIGTKFLEMWVNSPTDVPCPPP